MLCYVLPRYKTHAALGLLSTAIARFIAEEVRHGIDGTQYLDGQNIPDLNVPADVFQDVEEDDPHQDPNLNDVFQEAEVDYPPPGSSVRYVNV